MFSRPKNVLTVGWKQMVCYLGWSKLHWALGLTAFLKFFKNF